MMEQERFYKDYLTIDSVLDGLTLLLLEQKAHFLLHPKSRDWVKMDKIAILTKAIEFLKAQEPRVLTLEEVRALPTAPPVAVVIEERVPIDSWDGGSVCKWVGSLFVQEEYLGDNVYVNASTYEKIWRVWTAWPSDEQIGVTPWN